MQKDSLDGLLALKLVAEKKNFTLAAEELSITPSAISQIIKNLEEKLGVVLLTRTTRSLSLTEAGTHFLNRITPAIDEILDAINDVGNQSNKPSGILRINLPKIVYHSYLAPHVKTFVKKYPEITLELFFEDASSDVVDKGFDAGIRLSDILAKDMVAIKLYGPIKFVVAGSPSYFKTNPRPKHPKDLLNHNCVVARLGGGFYDRWEFESRGKEFQVKVKGNIVANDSTMLTDMAVEGIGLVYTVESRIKDMVKEKKLEIVLRDYVTSSEGFYLYFPSTSQVLPKLRCFINHLKENS